MSYMDFNTAIATEGNVTKYTHISHYYSRYNANQFSFIVISLIADASMVHWQHWLLLTTKETLVFFSITTHEKHWKKSKVGPTSQVSSNYLLHHKIVTHRVIVIYQIFPDQLWRICKQYDDYVVEFFLPWYNSKFDCVENNKSTGVRLLMVSF